MDFPSPILFFFLGGGEGWLGYHATRATRTEDQGVGGLTSSCYITGELFSFIIPPSFRSPILSTVGCASKLLTHQVAIIASYELPNPSKQYSSGTFSAESVMSFASPHLLPSLLPPHHIHHGMLISQLFPSTLRLGSFEVRFFLSSLLSLGTGLLKMRVVWFVDWVNGRERTGFAKWLGYLSIVVGSFYPIPIHWIYPSHGLLLRWWVVSNKLSI